MKRLTKLQITCLKVLARTKGQLYMTDLGSACGYPRRRAALAMASTTRTLAASGLIGCAYDGSKLFWITEDGMAAIAAAKGD